MSILNMYVRWTDTSGTKHCFLLSNIVISFMNPRIFVFSIQLNFQPECSKKDKIKKDQVTVVYGRGTFNPAVTVCSASISWCRCV